MTATIRAGLDHRPAVNTSLLSWVREVAELTTPDRVVWVDGSDEEWERMATALVDAGTFTRLAKKPNSFYAASDPDDVARVEERTFICSAEKSGAGPTRPRERCAHTDVHWFEEVHPMIRSIGIRAGDDAPLRRVVSYWCVHGHHTPRQWSADATAPELWECRCGLPAQCQGDEGFRRLSGACPPRSR